TNRPDLIAKELLSHERFGKEIRFSLPDAKQRKKFFELKFLKQLMLERKDIDVDLYVRCTAGCNYGQLQDVVDTAQALANNHIFLNGQDLETVVQKPVEHKHIQEAINRKIYRLTSHELLEGQELEVVAAHQAGHALVHALLNPSRLEFVTTR